ncbi:transposase [uncultured Duodenibacillus sp.]|uniref:transposase n=1 Tax=uncultured Duodenibacillus sp. TaxID=1980699 RepID=UPI002584A2FF|nr:transposase [uncultured Duodenibacillus sp.]
MQLDGSLGAGFNDFDDAIIDLYGRGLSAREITEFIRSQYHVEVSAEFISTVTEKVNDDVRQWQGRHVKV